MSNELNEQEHELTEGTSSGWDNFDIQKFYDMLAFVIGKKEGLEIEFTLIDKSTLTPEELEKLERERSGNDPSNN